MRVKLDPQTGQAVTARETRGGDFFYRFHFELEIGFPWGRWLASIAGMFMLVAIISGVITHKKIFADFFTFRPKKGGQRAWMDGHNALSVLGLPFHLMITFSGLVLFMGMLMPAGILAVYDDARQFSDFFASFKVTPPRVRPRPDRSRALGGAGRKPLAGQRGARHRQQPRRCRRHRDADAQRGRRRVLWPPVSLHAL